MLRRTPGVKSVDRDWKVRKLTTHTPQFLGLPTGVWPTGGGFDRAGENIVIGFVNSGIFPHHPSFQNHRIEPYEPLPRYRGKCEVDPYTKRASATKRLLGPSILRKLLRFLVHLILRLIWLRLQMVMDMEGWCCLFVYLFIY